MSINSYTQKHWGNSSIAKAANAGYGYDPETQKLNIPSAGGNTTVRLTDDQLTGAVIGYFHDLFYNRDFNRVMGYLAEGYCARPLKESDSKTVTAGFHVPASIADLSAEKILSVIGSEPVKIAVTPADVVKFGLHNSLPEKLKKSLQDIVDAEQENASIYALISELFGITTGSIKEKSETGYTIAVVVPIDRSRMVVERVKASLNDGWSIDVANMIITSDMSAVQFELSRKL